MTIDKTLKLDFNERADSTPQWLNSFIADTQCLWLYPNRKEVELLIAEQNNATVDNVFLSNGGDEAIELLFKLLIVDVCFKVSIFKF